MKSSVSVAFPLGHGAERVTSELSAVVPIGTHRWWWKRMLRALGLEKGDSSSVDLAYELQALKGAVLKDQRPVGLTAQLIIGLLKGMQQLATTGRHRMEQEAHVHLRLCEHVRELGLMAGSQNLPMSRLQRWMEERVLLEGLMSGTLGDLGVALPTDGVNYLRQPLLHMAVFEHLCTMAWASNAGRNGRISVRLSNGALTYQLMLSVEGGKDLPVLAQSIWELEKICIVSATVSGPQIEISMSILKVTITASA